MVDKLKNISLIVIVGVLVLMGAWYLMVPSNQDISACNQDRDCGCGVNKTTNACAIGNIQYIDTQNQCPDYCSGIDGSLEIKCISNVCKQVSNQE